MYTYIYIYTYVLHGPQTFGCTTTTTTTTTTSTTSLIVQRPDDGSSLGSTALETSFVVQTYAGNAEVLPKDSDQESCVGPHPLRACRKGG